MKIKTITCPNCKDEIYSRAQHDFKYCSCGDIFIDGGLDLTRFGFKKEKPQIIERELDITKQELYNDWNKKIDKYGKYNA